MADISECDQSEVVRITGQDESYVADVVSHLGLNKLATISDSVITEGCVSGRIIEYAEMGGSNDLRVNGFSSSKDFYINASPTKEKFFRYLRFEAIAKKIEFDEFLSKNTSLSNGILVTIRSNNSELTFPPIKVTTDFGTIFAIGSDNFNFFEAKKNNKPDYLRATLTFPIPIQIYKQGTFGTDDFIRIRIQDNLTTGNIEVLKFIGFGFERDT